MDAKTILVHFDKDVQVEQLITAVSPLACDAKSHVVGIFVMPPVPSASDLVVPFRSQLIKEYQNEFGPVNQRMKEKFEQLCGGQPFTSEWRFVEGPITTLAEGIMPESRAADLIVASAGPRPEDTLDARNIPQVILNSGRPVILIPTTGTFSLVDMTVTIAWNDRREATRALFDAIPLLHRAKSIRILTIAEEKDFSRAAMPMPAADIAASLARHGLDVDILTAPDDGGGAGSTILRQATNDGSDLIVMGAYGHSRLRELVLGGATRHVLQHTKVPVFMAH